MEADELISREVTNKLLAAPLASAHEWRTRKSSRHEFGGGPRRSDSLRAHEKGFALIARQNQANSESYAKENYAKLKMIAGEVAEWLNAAVC